MVSKRVSRRLGISQRRADRIIAQTLGTIVARLCEREPVKLEDFGTFEVRPQKGWNGRHPVTGKHVVIRDRWAVCFRPGKKLRRQIADRRKRPGP